jgi:hypothetical protein
LDQGAADGGAGESREVHRSGVVNCANCSTDWSGGGERRRSIEEHCATYLTVHCLGGEGGGVLG